MQKMISNTRENVNDANRSCAAAGDVGPVGNHSCREMEQPEEVLEELLSGNGGLGSACSNSMALDELPRIRQDFFSYFDFCDAEELGQGAYAQVPHHLRIERIYVCFGRLGLRVGWCLICSV